MALDDVPDDNAQMDLQDLQDQQLGITTGVTPSAFQQTGPGVYSPYSTPAPAPAPPSALPRTGITPRAAPRPRFDPSNIDTSAPSVEGNFYKPEIPTTKAGTSLTWEDYGRQVWGSTVQAVGSISGGVDWIEKQIAGDPEMRTFAGRLRDGLNQYAQYELDGLSPRAKEVLSAGIVGYTPDDWGLSRGPGGEQIPTPGSVGWSAWATMHVLSMVPDGVAMLVPGRFIGAAAVKAAEWAGTATKLASTVGHAVGTGAYFSLETAGQFFNNIVKQVGDASDKVLQDGSPYYAELRKTMPVEQAKPRLVQSLAPLVAAAGAAGFVGGAGAGAGSGVVRGALSGAAAMGVQGGATSALEQGAGNALGQRPHQGYDFGSILADAAAGVVQGGVLGAVGGLFHPKADTPAAKPPGPGGGVDPANQEALAAAGISNEPPDGGGGGGASTAPPPSGAPPPPSTQPDMSGVPGYSPPPVPQRVFPTESLTRPYTPPESEVTGVPGYSPPPPDTPPPPPPPPPGGSARPPAAQAAVDASVNAGRARPRAPRGDVPPGVPVEVAPTGEARVVGAPAPAGPRPSGTMKKAELNDALVGMGIDTKGMNRDDMARRFDREQSRAPSTPTPPDTTVTEGPPTAPARETVPGPGAETQAAPPEPGALTPPAPEGVRETPPTTEPTADISTGVRPEGGAPPATDERPAGATAEQQPVTPGVTAEAKEDPRDAAMEKLANVRRMVKVPRGSPVEDIVNRAFAEMQERITKSSGSDADMMQMLREYGAPREGDTPLMLNARQGIAKKLSKQIEGKEMTFQRVVPKAVDARSEIEQVRAEEQQRGGEEATRKATTSEAVEEKATGASETGETTGLEAVDEKLPKGTSIPVKAKALVRQILDPQHAMDVPTAEKILAKTSNLGRPRTKGFGDLHDAFETEWKRITGEVGQKAKAKLEAELARLDRQQPMTEEGTQGRVLEEQQHDRAVAKVQKQLEEYAPERLIAMAKAMKEIADPIKDAADKREALVARAAEIKGETPDIPLDAPLNEGINPRSSRYVTGSADPRLGANYEAMFGDRIRGSGAPVMAREAATMIAQDPMVRAEQGPLREVAERFMRLLPADVPIMSLERAMREGRIKQGLFNDLRSRNVYGAYDPESRTILHNLDGPRITGSHVETALHEMSHAISFHYLRALEMADKFHPDLRVLNAIRSELRDHVLAESKSGILTEQEVQRLIKAIGNNHELHTQMFTDPVVQGFASAHKASQGLLDTLRSLGHPGSPGQSVWRAFANWVRKATGQGPAKSASEFTLFDHIIKPVTDIQDRAAEFNKRLLPDDPGLRAQGEPVYDGITSSFIPRARDAFDHIDPAGLGDKARRGLLAATTSDAMVSRYRGILPGLDSWRAAYEGIARTGKVFSDKFSDRVRDLTRRYNGSDDQQALGHLMNDATLAEVHLGSDKADANAHLTTPEQQTALRDLQQRYDKLSPDAKALYGEYRDTYNEWYKQQRTAELNALVRGFMPDATDAQREAFNRAAASKSALEKFLKDPDNSAIAASFGEDWTKNRALARGIAQVHSKGFVQGDYFPLRRFGDYVVRTGNAADPANYSVEMFESRQKAEARRAELVRNGAETVHQVADRRESDMRDLVPHHPAVDELVASLGKRGYTEGEAKEVRDTLNSILLQHATHAEATKARMRRRGVRGAATDQARVLASEFLNNTARMGHLEYGLARSRALSEMRNQVTALERPDATPGQAITAASVLREAEKRSTAVDANNVMASLAAKANSFSFAQSLMSPSHMFTSTLEAHSNSMAFLGARHGIGRATLALTRALAQASPVLGKGVMNTLSAVRGELKASDWNLSHLVRDRMIAKGSNKAGLAQLFKALEDAGLIDHTVMQDLRRQANPTGAVRSVYGDVWNRFQAFSAASAHAVDVMNKSAIAKAAFDLEFQRTRDVNAAVSYAVETARKAMPNYNIGNKARVATARGPLGALGAPLMQFKNYGLHEMSILANLARESMSGPGRWEARKAFAGVLASRAMMAGVITLIADPLRYIGGAYNLVTGAQKPHDYQNDVRSFLNDILGPELGELVSRGLPHALGIDIHNRVGLANLLEIPEMNSFDAAGAGQVLLGLMTGATGDNLAKDWDGLTKVFQGNVLGGAQTMLPRPVRDVMSAVDLAQKGVTTQRGRVLVPPSKISAGAVAARAMGFQPAIASEAREGSAAIQERFQEAKDERTQLSNRWLQASPNQRQSIMQEIQQFNRDPAHHGMQLTMQQLLRDQQQRRQQAKAPFGLRLPKQAAKSLSQAGAFANVP